MTATSHRIPAPVLEYGKDPTAVLLKDDHQPALSFYVLDQLRRTNQFCDIVIKIKSARLNAHKAVLASSSPRFMSLLCTNLELSEIVIEDPELDVTALEMVMEFIYTSVLRITEGTVEILCSVARFLQMERIERACCKFMVKNLSPTNCVHYLHFAKSHSYSHMLYASQEFILKHLQEVSETPTFQNLTGADLVTLLENKMTAECSQRVVIISLLKWVKHDTITRQKELYRLLTCIRLSIKAEDPDNEQLLETVLKEDHTDVERIFEKLRVCFKSRCSSTSSNVSSDDQEKKPESDRYHNQILEPDQLESVKPEEEKEVEYKMEETSKKEEFTNTLLFAVGGSTKKSTTNMVERYDSCNEGWVATTPLPRKKSHTGLVAFNKRLYSIGGFDGAKRLSSVDIYDLGSDVWEEGNPMPTARSAFGVAVVGRHAFCIGGFDGVAEVATVEILDLKNSLWKIGPSLQQARSYVQAAALGGTIYAVGGSDGNSRLSSVEKLTIGGCGKWEMTGELNIPRSRPGVAVLDSKLYAVGGYSGTDHLSSVECYSPQNNQWVLIERMSVPRNSPAVSVVDDCLFVAGGHDGRKLVRSVEKYDPKNREWKKVASMQTARCDFGMATIQTSGSLMTATWT